MINTAAFPGRKSGGQSPESIYSEPDAPCPQMSEHAARMILTAYDVQLMRARAAGMTSEEIASMVGRSPHSVHAQLARIRRKMRCDGVPGAVQLFCDLGLMRDRDPEPGR